MTTQNLIKTIVTYQGGSAGDLFTKSCNGEFIKEQSTFHVPQDATLKNFEQKLKEGQDVSLDEELESLNYSYVNTHLFEEILNKGYPVVSIILMDPSVQMTVIYRQLQLQRLRMKIDENDEWYINTRNFCLSKKYDDAAEYWFDNNKNYWLRRMKIRLETDVNKKLNFDELFSDNFVNSLKKQGWTHNLDVLYDNHSTWLEKNSNFSLEKTLERISYKLSMMDWTLSSGWVIYQPK